MATVLVCVGFFKKMQEQPLTWEYIGRLGDTDRKTLFDLCVRKHSEKGKRMNTTLTGMEIEEQIALIVALVLEYNVTRTEFLCARIIEMNSTSAVLDADEAMDMVSACAAKFGKTVDEVLQVTDPIEDERRREMLSFLCLDPANWTSRGPRFPSDFTQGIIDQCLSRTDKCTSAIMAVRRGHVKCLERYRDCSDPGRDPESCPGCSERAGDYAEWDEFPSYCAILSEQMECFWVALTFPQCKCVFMAIHGEILEKMFTDDNPQYWIDVYVRFVTETKLDMSSVGGCYFGVTTSKNYNFVVDAFNKLGFGPTGDAWDAASNADALEFARHKTLKRPYPWQRVRSEYHRRFNTFAVFDFFTGMPH